MTPTIYGVKGGKCYICEGRKGVNVSCEDAFWVKQTIGHVPLYEQSLASALRLHEHEIETHEIGGGTEVYGICIAFVPFLEERREGAS